MHPRFCNASCWSFWPLATTDGNLPGEVIYVSIIGGVEGRVEGLCLLIASLHKSNKTQLEPGEPTRKTDCKIVTRRY